MGINKIWNMEFRMGKFKDITGQRFDRWLVLSRAGSIGRYAAFLCRCDCGTERIIRGHHLSTGASKSCGCLAVEERSKTMKKSNERRWQNHKKHHPRLYRIWTDIRRRCLKESRPEYKNYGAKGIKMCPDWDGDFITFYKWAINNGYSDNLTIDRINPFGDYEPNNCRWITNQEQQRNRKYHVIITVDGVSKKAWEWEAETGIPAEIIRQRIISGWSPERAVFEAIHKEFSHTSKKGDTSGTLF
jgi:hypothetical protein